MQELIKKHEVLVQGEVVNKGDLVYVEGERRRKFMFMNLVINPETGKEWVDLIELMKGNDGPFRSFRPEKLRLMKGGKRG